MKTAEAFQFTCLTTQACLFDACPVVSLTLPGQTMDVQVFKGHTPLILALKPGLLTIETSAETQRYFIEGGFTNILPEHTTILTTGVSALESLDPAILTQELEHLKNQLHTIRDKNLLEEHQYLENQRICQAKLDCLDALGK